MIYLIAHTLLIGLVIALLLSLATCVLALFGTLFR